MPGLNAQVLPGVGVAWKANSEPDLAGYYVYYGPQSGLYTNRVAVSRTATRARIEPLVPGATYYIAMTAYNTGNFESLPTAELVYQIPRPTNTAPAITGIPQQVLLEDHPSASIQFTVSDAESPGNTLTIKARSSNPRLIPDQYVLIGGTGNDRTLMIVPQLDQWGRADITLEVRDAQGASNTMTFPVIVDPLNDDPIVSPIANQVVNEDTTDVIRLPFYTFDAETPPDELWLLVFSSDPSIIPDQNLTITGTGNSRAVNFTLPKDAYGSCLIDVFAVDPDGSYGWTGFSVTVRPVNDAPTLDPIPSFTVDEGSGPLTVPLSGISSGATNEAQPLVVSAVSSHPEIVPAPQIAYISPAALGSLLVLPAPNMDGTAVITVTVSDGQAVNGTTNQSFVVTVRDFNNPPVIYTQKDLWVLRIPSAPLQIPFTLQDPDTPLDLLVVSGHSSDATILPSSSLALSGTGTQRTLTITPIVGRTGLVTVTIVVSDGNSTVSTSFYVLVTAASS